MLHFTCSKNLALNIINWISLCLSDETLKAVGPFYLVSMRGEVNDPKRLLCNLSWTPHSSLEKLGQLSKPLLC